MKTWLASTNCQRHKQVLGSGRETGELSEWISVEEGLPDNRKYVLICLGKKTVEGYLDRYGENQERLMWFTSRFAPEGYTNGYVEGVTHWMPLPAPPATSSAEGSDKP